MYYLQITSTVLLPYYLHHITLHITSVSPQYCISINARGKQSAGDGLHSERGETGHDMSPQERHKLVFASQGLLWQRTS
jgi:hypothetical protein